MTHIISLEHTDFHVPATQVEAPLSGSEREAKLDQMAALLAKHNAALVAHYYTDPLMQALAERSGGFIGDSLEMARFGRDCEAETLVVAGVKFMGETAKILAPNKRIIMPTLEATCSLDLGCDPDQLAQMKAANPDRTLVVYANTSARVKAIADWVVTSSIAVDVVEDLTAKGEKILWAPDQHLGGYIAKQTGADMMLWNGSCIVHEEFKAHKLEQLKAAYPDAAVLVHPESPASVVNMADVVGSTTQLLNASQTLENQVFIVATDRGIFYKMQQASPKKTFIEAPTGGEGATCRSCAHCPWMAMNTLDLLARSLEDGSNEIFVEPELIPQALKPLNRMLDFASKR